MTKALKLFWMGLLSASILANPFSAYPGRDSGIFLYIGSLVLKGKIPYIDAWENKGPLIFYLNALGLAITGGSRWGVWLIEFLFLFSSSYIGYLIIKRLMGEVPALLGTFIWVVAAGNVLQGGNYSEEYSLLFSFIALFFFLNDILLTAESTKENTLRPSWLNGFLIGATLGFNILLRPNNISIQVAIAGTYFILTLFSKNWRMLISRAVQIVAGMLVVILPVLLYFAENHALTEMINVVIVFNSQYSEGGGLSRVIEGILNAANGIGFFWVGIAIIGYILAMVALFKNKNLNSQEGGFLLVLLIGLPVEAVLSTVSGKNYPHYFIGWSLYAGLLGSYAVYVLIDKLKLKIEKFSMQLVVILSIITLAAHLSTWQNYGTVLAQIGKPNAQFDYRDAVADYIQQNTAPEDKVLVWGFRPVINFASGRESPVTYLPYPLSHVDTPLAQYWADGFYVQLKKNPPTLIINVIEEADRERIPDLDPQVRKGQKIKWKEVVLAYNYKDVLEFIGKNYIRVDTVNGNNVYRLRTSK